LYAVDGDLDDLFRPDPHHTAVAFPALRLPLVGTQLHEPLGLPAQHLIGHPLEGLPDHHELADAVDRAIVARTEMDVRQESSAPSAPPLGGEDHQVERVDRLDLSPTRTTSTGFVGSGQILHHHALMPGRDGGLEERLGLGRVGGDDRWREISLRHRRHQPAAALPEWLVDDRLTVDHERTEEPGPQLAAACVVGSHPGLGGEVADRVLEGSGRLVVGDTHHLAVEYQVTTWIRRNSRHDPGQACRHVVEIAGEESDPTAGSVSLDSSPVEQPRKVQ